MPGGMGHVVPITPSWYEFFLCWIPFLHMWDENEMNFFFFSAYKWSLFNFNGKQGWSRTEDHESRKGSGKSLWTLIMRLSLVTQCISGPGNWPLMRIPCTNITIHINQTRLKIFAWMHACKKLIEPVGEHPEDIYHHKWFSSQKTCKDFRHLQLTKEKIWNWPIKRNEQGSFALMTIVESFCDFWS